MRTYKFNNPHFETNNKLVYQKYSLFESVNFIKKNYKNLLVIIDKNFYKNSKYILRFIKILKKNKIKITLFLYDYNFEPSYDYVDKITSKLKTKIKRFDCIFSCGGGSALDFSKALAITLKNKKKSRFFRGFFEKINAFPIISAPTTVSTGSEASYFAPIIDENISVKFGINVKSNTPILSILDPKLIIGSKKNFVMMSALSSLIRAIETYFSRSSTFLSRKMSKISFDLLYENIKKYNVDPSNLEIINKIQLGTYFSVVGLSNSSAGLAGSLSYHFSTKEKIPQSLAHAVAGLYSIKININNRFYKYGEILEGNNKKINLKKKSQILFKFLNNFYKKYRINFDNYKIKSSFLDYQKTLPDISKKHFKNNPIDLKSKEVEKIFNLMTKK